MVSGARKDICSYFAPEPDRVSLLPWKNLRPHTGNKCVAYKLNEQNQSDLVFVIHACNWYLLFCYSYDHTLFVLWTRGSPSWVKICFKFTESCTSVILTSSPCRWRADTYQPVVLHGEPQLVKILFIKTRQWANTIIATKMSPSFP